LEPAAGTRYRTGVTLTASIGTDIAHAAELLRGGDVVGMPTETVYGLAAVAFDERAVVKVFEVKGRPSFDPLIVHLASASELARVADLAALTPKDREQVLALAARFWPGPLTLVLPKQAAVPDLVTSGLDTVAVRVPAHPMARALIEAVGAPLAAPSANPFGYVSPTQAEHVAQQLGHGVPYVLDGGACDVGVESTILAAPRVGGATAWTVLRDGGLTREALQEALGLASLADATAVVGRAESPAAPGQLESHYAPLTPLRHGPLPALLSDAGSARVHVIAFREAPAGVSADVLSPAGDLGEAARRLFALMRRADTLGAELILAERVPNEGLGRAINDRLRRASAGGGADTLRHGS
jgi:L-threonylcarbamoyladenylate synthase